MGKKGKGKKEAAPKPLPPELVEAVATLLDGPDAAAKLASLACEGDVMRQDCAAAGAIPPLITLISPNTVPQATPVQKENAAHALRALAANNPLANKGAYDNSDAIVAGGGIPALVALLRGGSASTETQVEHAAGALANLATRQEHRKAIMDAGAAQPLIGLIGTGTEAQASAACLALGSLAFSHAESQAAITQEGGVAALTELSARVTCTEELREHAKYALRQVSDTQLAERRAAAEAAAAEAAAAAAANEKKK